ncbi:MAG: hypothetical protein HRT94_03245 [Alphaproteobacteria bacterium]|nr:hypothetical protein [Alphaproteobacteria bacterium]
MRNYFHIFVLLSFLVGVIAPACGLSWGGKYSVIEICTADGWENRIVENNQSGTPSNSDHSAKEQCQFCIQTSLLKNMILPSSNTLMMMGKAERIQISRYQTLRDEYAQSLYNPRAPPFLV